MNNNEELTLNNFEMLALLEQVVSAVGESVAKINERIKHLEEAEHVNILPEIDFDRSDYPNNSLARHAQGLWSYKKSENKWVCAVNSIADVELIDTDGLARLVITKSDGNEIERILPFARTRKKVINTIN